VFISVLFIKTLPRIVDYPHLNVLLLLHKGTFTAVRISRRKQCIQCYIYVCKQL